jgi:hypothetical protein
MEKLTRIGRIYRMKNGIEDLRFEISNLKLFYPVYPVHPC